AYDVKNGDMIWKTDRSEFMVGYASPVLMVVGGKNQIVQAGTLRVVGYDLETGKEIWTVRGLSRICNMTPTVSPDNILYLTAWGVGADPGDIVVIPPFEEYITKYDANKNGVLEAEEIPVGPVKERFPQFDRNRDGHIDREEWNTMRQAFATAKN